MCHCWSALGVIQRIAVRDGLFAAKKPFKSTFDLRGLLLFRRKD
jgi:hypothetical protein